MNHFIFLEEKRPQPEAYHSLTHFHLIPKIRFRGDLPSSPVYHHGMVLKYWENLRLPVDRFDDTHCNQRGIGDRRRNIQHQYRHCISLVRDVVAMSYQLQIFSV